MIDNNQWKVIPPEELLIGTEYSLTLNINPELIRKFGNITNQYFQYLRQLANLKYCTYDLTFELSKLGKLHCHGTIKVVAKQEFYFYDVHKLKNAFSFEMDTINDLEKWNKYVNKNFDSMNEFLKEYSLKVNINNVYVRTIMVNLK